MAHRKIVVVVGSQSSQLQDISAGVPQDRVLSTTIFSYFINDLHCIIRSEVGMFADDCAMFSTIRNSSDTEAVHVQMQQDLDNIQAWAVWWQVTFTPHKCQARTTSNKRQCNHRSLAFNGVTITESPLIKILGAIFDHRLNWTHHINTVATRAGLKLGILRQVNHLLTPQSLSAIHKAQARSVMEYSPLVWMDAAPTKLKKLDTIQDKAARLIGTTSTSI
eukprot:g17630.t1